MACRAGKQSFELNKHTLVILWWRAHGLPTRAEGLTPPIRQDRAEIPIEFEFPKMTKSSDLRVRLRGIMVREGVRRGVLVAWVVVCKNRAGYLDCGDCERL